MPLVVNNPFGMSNADIMEDTAAERVGRRIRKIRTARGMSQAELGARIGLNADRVQKYENGVRKPKTEMLKLIARALNVEADALMDPVPIGWIGVMFALFEMEEYHGIEPCVDGSRSYLQFGNGWTDGMSEYIKNWYQVKEKTKIDPDDSEEEKKRKLEYYNNWKWTYPQTLVDETERGLKKAQIKSKIKQLEEQLKALEETKD